MILGPKAITYQGIVTPLVERAVIRGRSYGLDYSGVDVRIAQSFDLHSGDFVLGSTIEYFKMPLDVVGFVKNKSSWVRRGIDAAHDTVLEPGWEGYLTVEITHSGYQRIRITEGDPIVKIVFMRMDQEVNGYKGKYHQQGPGPQEAKYEV